MGTAYIHGFKWALDKGYRFIFEMDCDFSHNPHDLDKLYEACKNGGADVAIGSRYVKGGKWKTGQESGLLFKRRFVYTRLITLMPVKDPTAGFVCYRKEVLGGNQF